MGASNERIERGWDVKETKDGKASVLTIRVKYYHNTGMIQVDKHPINKSPEYDVAQGWIGAIAVVVQTVQRFAHKIKVEKRRKEK